MKYYHVTSEKNLEGVLSQGLVPKKEKRGAGFEGSPEGIYLFKTLDEAEDAVMNWLGDEIPEDEEPVILEVDLPEEVSVEDDPELPLSAVIVKEPIPAAFIKMVDQTLTSSLLEKHMGQKIEAGEERESFLPPTLIMCDLEMEGVVPDRDKILQVAMTRLDLSGNQYQENGEPLVLYLHNDGQPRTDFHKQYLSHIFKKCNESDLTPEGARNQIHDWLGDLKGKVTPVGDCVPTDIEFLKRHGLIDQGDIVDDEQVPGTFHYEFFDLHAVKAIARHLTGSKHTIAGIDEEHIHDALVDCRNQTLELNHFLKVLLPEDAWRHEQAEDMADPPVVRGSLRSTDRKFAAIDVVSGFDKIQAGLPTVDLHGMSVPEAEQMIDHLSLSDDIYKVITGHGKGVLKNLVRDLQKTYGYRIVRTEPNDAAFIIDFTVEGSAEAVTASIEPTPEPKPLKVSKARITATIG